MSNESTAMPPPPKTYENFVERFPELAQAWELMGQAGSDGPLDGKALRLVKLGIAIGAMREGSIHSCVRKAVAAGATPEEIDQVTVLAASTIGMSATVAVHTWIQDVMAKG